jgi:multidrug transporter EmrE-like cation transporter
VVTVYEHRHARVAQWVCIAIGLLLALHAVRSYGYWHKGTHDHSVYWMAGERMAAGDADMYEPPRDDSNMVGAFIYPPSFAALFAPLTFLPRQAGYAIWAAFQLVFFGLGAVLLLRAPGTRSWPIGLWTLLALLWPLMANISAGQINTLIALLCIAGWLQLEKGHDLRAGALFALGAHIKVLPVVLLAMLVVQRRYRAAAAMAAAGALLMFLPFVWMAPKHGFVAGLEATVHLDLSYAQRLRGGSAGAESQSGSGWNADIDMWRKAEGNLAFAGMAERHLEAGPVRRLGMWAGFAVALAMFAGALVLARRVQSATGRLGVIGLCMIAAALGNQLAWQAHMVLLAMVVLPVLADSLCRPPRWYLWALGCYMALSELPPLLGYQLLFPSSVYDFTAQLQSWGIPTAAVCGVWIASALYWKQRSESDTTSGPMSANIVK